MLRWHIVEDNVVHLQETIARGHRREGRNIWQIRFDLIKRKIGYGETARQCDRRRSPVVLDTLIIPEGRVGAVSWVRRLWWSTQKGPAITATCSRLVCLPPDRRSDAAGKRHGWRRSLATWVHSSRFGGWSSRGLFGRCDRTGMVRRLVQEDWMRHVRVLHCWCTQILSIRVI